MIITPAILTNELIILKLLLEKYKDFKLIDIDISKPPFIKEKTLQLEEILGLLEDYNYNFGFHFMVKEPELEVNKLKNSQLRFRDVRIYIHQESDHVEYISSMDLPQKWTLNGVVKVDSELLNIEFYSKFNEVQFMTHRIGVQGAKFQKKIFKKIQELKNLGYKGKISIDGGVNLNTAPLIKEFGLIDRVSVGSYFQKSSNIYLCYNELNNFFIRK